MRNQDSLKKCLNCGAVSSDEEPLCGVCGTGLTKTISVSLHQATQVHDPSSQMKTETNRRQIVGLFIGLFCGSALLIAGIAGLFFLGPPSVALLIPGLGITLFFFLWVDSYSPLPHVHGVFSGPSVAGEERREAAEERDRESGADD